MERLGIKATPAVICFLLALMFPLFVNTAGVYAQGTYIKITSPQNGDIITTDTFGVTADYSRKDVNDEVIVRIYPVGSPRGNGYSKGLGPVKNGTAIANTRIGARIINEEVRR
jgi:hypothetical protein